MITPSAEPPREKDDPPVELWRDMLKYFPAVVLPRLTGLITVPVLTRVFPANVLGTYNLVLATVGALTAVGMTGLGSALLRFLPEYSKEPQGRSKLLSLVLSLAAGLTMLIILAGGAWLAFCKRRQDPFFAGLMLIGLFVFAASGMFGLLMLVLRSERRIGLFSKAQLYCGFGTSALGLLLVLAGSFDISGMLWGTLIATLVTTIVVWPLAIGSDFRLPRGAGSSLRALVSFAVYVSLGSSAYWLLSLSDRWLIELYLGSRAVGIYSVSYDLTGKTSQLLVAAFSLAMQPAAIGTYVRQGRAGAEALISRSTRLYLILLLPATLGLSVLARQILEVLTTREYTGGAIVVPFIACAMFCYGLIDLASRGLTMAKRPDLEARNFGIVGLLNLFLNMLLIPRFGFVAAAATTLIGYLVLLLLHVLTVRKYLTWRFPWATLGRVSAATAGMVGAISLIDSTMHHVPSLVRLLILIPLGLISYSVGIFLTGEISVKQVVSAVRAVWSRNRK